MTKECILYCGKFFFTVTCDFEELEPSEKCFKFTSVGLGKQIGFEEIENENIEELGSQPVYLKKMRILKSYGPNLFISPQKTSCWYHVDVDDVKDSDNEIQKAIPWQISNVNWCFKHYWKQLYWCEDTNLVLMLNIVGELCMACSWICNLPGTCNMRTGG